MSKIVVFKCGNEEFGLPVEVVREVRRLAEVTPIPHALDFVEGIIHLRGHPVAIVDLAKRLGISKKESARSRIVVAKARGTIVGLTVDSVSEVLEAPVKSFTPTPSIALPVDDGYIKNITDLSGRMILILDLDKILSQEETLHIRQIKEQHKKKANKNG
ncbi:MAG: chemotaxis protein CheW [Candidatus Margulisiibacteriota bacterium]